VRGQLALAPSACSHGQNGRVPVPALNNNVPARRATREGVIRTCCNNVLDHALHLLENQFCVAIVASAPGWPTLSPAGIPVGMLVTSNRDSGFCRVWEEESERPPSARRGGWGNHGGSWGDKGRVGLALLSPSKSSDGNALFSCRTAPLKPKSGLSGPPACGGRLSLHSDLLNTQRGMAPASTGGSPAMSLLVHLE
jgi:hypothetical protein